jgi:23S rRNA (cytidine2498-2'-O)-methyltransferase
MPGIEDRNRPGALVSCDPGSATLVEAELDPLFPGRKLLEWIGEGLALARTERGFDAFAAAVEQSAPVFVRHIAPVDLTVPLAAIGADLETLETAVAKLAGRLDPSVTFSVQSRILGEGKLPYRRVVLNEKLSRFLEARTGARMDCRVPEQVVSVLCTPTTGFLGISRTEQNMSAWPGGMHRFKDEDGQISRAEHKLLEAIAVFRMKLPSSGRALDMGAAPGGWTRVLRSRGLVVVAVDPADLDASLVRDPGVVHVRQKVQDYLSSDKRFDVIVDDMRMDASRTVEIMLSARANLKQSGLAVVTLKLPQEDRPGGRMLETVRALVARLGGSYTVLGARQLYHNRSEVTVALKAPD